MIRLWKYRHKEKAKETSAEKELRKRYNDFLSVLSENEHSLDLMTRLEEKLYNNQLISLPYLRSVMTNLTKHIAHMVETLIQLSGGDYTELREQYQGIDNTIREILTGRKERLSTPLIIPLPGIKKELADKVGNKMANLGEMSNCCGQLVPSGFAATACAYTHFIDYNNLTSQVHAVLSGLDPNDSQQLLEAEQTIKNLFLKAVVPPEIEQSIVQESTRLEKEKGHPLFWAVRSSAIGEDMAESSFAGQFSTLLNVPTDQLLQAYKEVAASKYNARVMIYQ
jgi:pyruvate,water dikinase